MSKQFRLPAFALPVAMVMILAITFPHEATAADCNSVDASGEFDELVLGDEVYAGLLAKATMTIKSIDREARKICGVVNGKEKCLSAERVYSVDGKAACVQAAKDAGPMDAGFIFLHGDEEEEDGEE